MAKRKIITIDEEKCTGCGECVPDCPEGALQMIEGKVRLISDLFCDGLGACIGTCPVDAISIEEREAEPYDERRVMENILKQGKNVVHAHLTHLKEHGEMAFLMEALQILKEKEVEMPDEFKGILAQAGGGHGHFHGCPGMKMMDLRAEGEGAGEEEQTGPISSQLRQWPIQLHLVSPMAPYFQGADILLAADCVAYSLGGFHNDYLKGKSLAIACPKLDQGTDIYVEKIRSLIDEAAINTLTVRIMQVPCCRGLLALAQQAVQGSKRKISVKCIVVGIKGEVLSEEWL